MTAAATSSKAADVAPLIDHTLLKPDATREAVAHLCLEARRHGFAAVCVNPWMVTTTREKLAQSPVKVCTVVGFPLGATTSSSKLAEAGEAVRNGAQELDMVLPLGALKEHDYKYVTNDIRSVVRAADGRTVKVILETCLLTDQEKVAACNLAVEAGAHFVKTSTGFCGGGATVPDVRLLRKTVGPGFGVKASGGIRSVEDALKMIDAGATRLGTSSGVAIVTRS